MIVAAPTMLWFLLGLPALVACALAARRRRAVVVGSTLIWRALRGGLQSGRGQLRLDTFTAAILGVFALAVFGVAEPGLRSAGGTNATPIIVVDQSSAALLERPGGGGALALDLAARLGGEWDDDWAIDLRTAGNAREGVENDNDRAARALVHAAKTAGARPLLILSPRRLAGLPENARQASYGVDPASLPFEKLETRAFRLYGRVTRPGSDWELVEPDGEVAARARASERDLLLELPRGRRNNMRALELRRVGAAPGKDRVWLWPRPRFRIGVRGAAPRSVSALRAALTDVCDVVESDFTLCNVLVVVDSGQAESAAPRPSVPPTLRIVSGSPNGVADGPLLARRTSAAFKYLPADWFKAGLASGSLGADEGGQVLLELRGLGNEVQPLLVLAADRRELVTTLDIFGSGVREGWVPLFLLGVAEELTGRAPLEEGPYATQRTPDAADRNALRTLRTPYPARPAPGLYASGVINPLAPPRHHLLTEDLLPEPLPAPLAAIRGGAGLFYAAAVVCLVFGVFMPLLVGERSRSSRGDSQDFSVHSAPVVAHNGDQ